MHGRNLEPGDAVPQARERTAARQPDRGASAPESSQCAGTAGFQGSQAPRQRYVATECARTTSRRHTAGSCRRTGNPATEIYLFGFSRGAYTARALSGMLRTVGLLRRGAGNLTPYGLKLYAKKGDENPYDEEKEFWRVRREFADQFGNRRSRTRSTQPDQVHFLGVWDTVKSVGWLNWKARFEQARWPFTAKIPNVDDGAARMAIDERRRPFPVYRFDPAWWPRPEGGCRRCGSRACTVTSAAVRGPQAVGPRVRLDGPEAAAAGLLVDEKAYKRLLGHAWDKPGRRPTWHWARSTPTPVGGRWPAAGGPARSCPATPCTRACNAAVEATRGTAAAYAPRLP